MTEQQPQAPKLSANEAIKANSRYLRGTIAEALAQDTTHFGKEDNVLLKSHGMYEQDDRDLRQALLKEKKEPAYGLMVRLKLPGGVVSAEQYLIYDKLADTHGNKTLRITTRQGFQFYSIRKKNIKTLMQEIHRSRATTLGACGDNVRNVLACPAPFHDRKKHQVREYAQKISDQFLSKSGAYEEVWLDGQKIDVDNKKPEELEPIYGKVYLPRKFKIAITFPDDNCVDVYSNDLGIVPEIKDDKLTGFNILVGGGFGTTHGIKTTYPRLASPLCFVKPEDLPAICTAVVIAQRDLGNRGERKNARLKYTIDRLGLPAFRAEVEKRFGKKTEDPHPIHWKGIENHIGWYEEEDGKWFLGLPVFAGRIKDEGSFRMKSGFRAFVEKYKPQVYLTAQQDIVFGGFQAGQKKEAEEFLASYGIPLPQNVSLLRRDAMACPALPTCGLAITESERALPRVITDLEARVKAFGIGEKRIMVRMTGCPNGCARPYNAEIAFVGRTVGTYNVYVGGNLTGDRLNFLYAEKIAEKDLTECVSPLLAAYSKQARQGEDFGDFCHRLGVEKLKTLSTPQSTPS